MYDTFRLYLCSAIHVHFIVHVQNWISTNTNTVNTVQCTVYFTLQAITADALASLIALMHMSTRLTSNPLPKLVKNLLAFLCAEPLDALLKFRASDDHLNGSANANANANRSLTLLLDAAQQRSPKAAATGGSTPAPQSPAPAAATTAATTTATSSGAKPSQRDPASQAFLEALGFFGGLGVHPTRVSSALAASRLSRALLEHLLCLRAPSSSNGDSSVTELDSGVPAALEQTRGIALAFAVLLHALPDAPLERHAHFAELWAQLILCIETPVPSATGIQLIYKVLGQHSPFSSRRSQ